MENTHTYPEFVILIGHHILVASLKGNVQQPEEEFPDLICNSPYCQPYNSNVS